MRSPWELSILQATEARFTQLFLIGEVLQPSDLLSGPPLDSLQEPHVLPALGAPGLDAVLQMGPHKCRGGQSPPSPSRPPLINAAQNTVGLPGCKRTLLAHVQLLVHQDPQVLLHRAALKQIFPQTA